MTILYFLRALAELGVYYTIAGTAAAIFGGQLALELFLLQSACFALSGVLRDRRGARLAALLPCLLPFLMPGSLADRLLALPPLLYLAYLAKTDSYQLSWERHRDLFERFCRLVLPAAALMALLRMNYLLTTGATIALLTAAASVLLMRSLRHEAEVYLQPRYQLMNAGGVALLSLGALVLGSKWTLMAAKFLAVNFYEYVVVPSLTAIGMLVGVFFLWIPKILRFQDAEEGGALQEGGWGGGEEEEFLTSAPPNSILQAIAAVAILAALAAVFYLLYRWYRNRAEEGDAPAVGLERRDLPEMLRGRRGQHSLLGNSAVHRIRRQYREFLRLCRKRGVQFGPSSTSGEIGEQAGRLLGEDLPLTDIQDIYRRARYQGLASRADAARLKKFCDQVRKRRTA